MAAGLSHSEIRGSRDICSLPRLIAAYHVLHRLCEPRHPPCALAYFISSSRLVRQLCDTAHKINNRRGSRSYFSCIVSSLVGIQEIIFYLCDRVLSLIPARTADYEAATLASYSLACVKMSKIVRHALKGMPKWRISGSNR